MPLYQVNIRNGAVVDTDACTAKLRHLLAATSPGAPVIVLIHGYKFSPFIEARNPHTHILSLDPRPGWKAVSWPRRLGLGQQGAAEPLVIALGWEARGTLWQAYARAADAGRGLADLIRLIGTLPGRRPVQVLAHSLGGRVALAALPHLPAGVVDRMILLAAAELQSRAATWLDCAAGRTVEVLNVRSRENAVFDRMLEWLVAPGGRGARAVSAGLADRSPRWIDLTVDDAATRAALEDLGYPIPAPDRRICHWSVYLRTGLFEIYRGVLSQDLPFALLRARLPWAETAPARRWSIAKPPLPSLRKGTS